MKTLRLLCFALLALALLPAAASAATITKTDATITYIADAQEINDVSISLAGDVYTVNEQGNAPGKGGITVKDGGGCQVATQGNTTTATCPAAGVTLLDVETGDQGDTVRILAPTASRILGGDGIDSLTGGDGPDQIFGEVGTDTLNGGGGDDQLSGGADDDTLNGGAGNDTLNGDDQNDTLNGDDGDDTLKGGAGGDALNGGAGRDTADYSDRGNPLTITIDGQAGDGEQGENDNVGTDVENVNGGGGNDTITGSDADNTLNGNGGNDTLNGLGGADQLNGGDGDDVLNGGAGPDTLSGGNGTDRVSYEATTVPVRVTLDGRPGDGPAGENDNVGADVESVMGGSAADVLIGNAGGNLHRRGDRGQGRRPDRLRDRAALAGAGLDEQAAHPQGGRARPASLLGVRDRGLRGLAPAEVRQAPAGQARLLARDRSEVDARAEALEEGPRLSAEEAAGQGQGRRPEHGRGRHEDDYDEDRQAVRLVRAVVQRVSRAAVRVDGEAVAEIGHGLLVLLGVKAGDDEAVAGRMVDKLQALRVFPDEEGRMNLSVRDVDGQILCVSNFTVYGDARKGNRPSFTGAALPDRARELYEDVRERLGAEGGVFGATMEVELVNHGPVTLVLEL